MAPLYQAINVQLQEDVPGSHTVYHAVADPEWTVAAYVYDNIGSVVRILTDAL